MSVSSKHIFEQGAVIGAMGRMALTALWQSLREPAPKEIEVPGPDVLSLLPPRSLDLVRDYVHHVGGDPSTYRSTLPPHLFPQWGFGPAMKTLAGLPYPLHRVMNAGCRLEIAGPLPNDEPLQVAARLEAIDDDGRRAIITQRVMTGTQSSPEALLAHMTVIVPLGGDPETKHAGDGVRRRPRVPDEIREVAFWHVGSKAGLDFAKLTGDFNPLHWVPPYARAFGFKNTILHGFSTMARAMEGLNRHLFSGGTPIRVFEARFTRPLVLPADVGLYVDEAGSTYVGDAPSGPAYMVGHYEF